MEAFVYILYYAVKDKYYVGCTENIETRLEQHNSARNLSTKHGIPWKIVHVESFGTLQLSRQREQYIKKMKSRKFTEQVIRGER
jgi:putative endonuclease